MEQRHLEIANACGWSVVKENGEEIVRMIERGTDYYFPIHAERPALDAEIMYDNFDIDDLAMDYYRLERIERPNRRLAEYIEDFQKIEIALYVLCAAWSELERSETNEDHNYYEVVEVEEKEGKISVIDEVYSRAKAIGIAKIYKNRGEENKAYNVIEYRNNGIIYTA